MSLVGTNEINQMGGGFPFGGGWGGFGGGWGGGIGGLGLVGLVGINNLFDRDRRGGDDCCDSNRDLAILAAVAGSKDTTVAEGRALASAICDSQMVNLQQFYAAAIQAANNTQSIKDQATALAIVNDKRFDDLAAQGVAQTAAILAKLNQTEIDNLRDQLTLERRGRDLDVIRIENNNINTNIQGQFQAQAQAQRERDFEFNRKFDHVLNQVASARQDIINVGSGVVGAAQTSTPTNINK